MTRACCAAIAFGLLLAASGEAAAQPGAALEPVAQAVCRLIENAARANRLPVGFMTRVIWRESSFRSGVVSPAGAEGIAQFMPQTAQERGLADPFDPEQAIPKAARLLADLRRQFGNLGIAAAAYNAGAARVALWLQGQAGLPAETRAYVRFVTERNAEEWTGAADSRSASATASDPAGATAGATARSCVALVEVLGRERGGADVDLGFAPLALWGVQLAGNFSKARALASFERAAQRYARVIGDERPMIIGRLLRSRGTRRFYQVRLPAASRAAAEALCRRILSVGGACVAMRSS
ncbi:MAG TPA: lytic transglycosylase domain-containing protein [Stellaceae bacterium]|nr:lytic transglycosylase domain-containing protein [Stellaceae bacterium]